MAQDGSDVGQPQEAQTSRASGRQAPGVWASVLEDMQVTPQGRRKHSFKHTSPGGTIRSDESFSPAGASRGDQRASCLCSESRVRGMQPCRNERHSPQYAGAIFFSTGQPTTTPISATSRGASSRHGTSHGTWGDTRCGFRTARASSQPLLSKERELALPSKRAVWVLVTTRTIGVCCSVPAIFGRFLFEALSACEIVADRVDLIVPHVWN